MVAGVGMGGFLDRTQGEGGEARGRKIIAH